MDSVSILVASATFFAAEVARKPADALATKLWDTVKAALRKVLEREPTPSDVSAATIRKAVEEVPAVAGALQAARSGSSGLRRAELVGNVLRGARVLSGGRSPRAQCMGTRAVAVAWSGDRVGGEHALGGCLP